MMMTADEIPFWGDSLYHGQVKTHVPQHNIFTNVMATAFTLGPIYLLIVSTKFRFYI
jgi:hypothetical protein